ncbi:hypothetical protein FACUT_5502 [Fusarium acutatum]|uniref:Uncharacterized protein n=1 Tax=Fusarium acutatum TaxID=78861 RepID=A0A8H4NH47_9HYPO|nr:hypothetical protein FACUT_5502 [Fusarium acutatum]
MFWDAYTHSMPHAEWFGELSMWLLLFLALRYGVTLQRVPNPHRRRGANVRRQDGEIQFELMCAADFGITADVPLSDAVTKYHPANHSLRFLFALTEFGTLCTCW